MCTVYQLVPMEVSRRHRILQLELQAFVSHCVGDGIKPGSPTKATGTCNQRVISLASRFAALAERT